MRDTDVRAVVEELFLHVAAMPWNDKAFVRSEVAQQAAEDQIVSLTVNKIMELQENGKKKVD